MPKKIDFNHKEMGKRYLKGESSTTLAIDYGVSQTTIFNRLKQLGIQRRKSGPLSLYDEAKICQMYRSGMEIQEIKEKTGAKNVSTFYTILHRNNVKLRLQRYKRNDPEVHIQIIRLNDQKLSQQAIANKIGLNRNYVREILNQVIHLPRKKWQKSVSIKLGMSIQEMRNADATIDEIAEIKQMSNIEVYKALNTSKCLNL